MRLIFAIAALSTLGATGPGAPKPTHPVVVELFTSQGCSSCPPADAFAEELARRPDVVVITRPVTYWDRLGWKDTLAREDNTQLQRAYAQKGGEGSGVYTPQTMVQGLYGAVGSDRSLVARQIANARKGITVAVAFGTGQVGVAGEGPGGDVKLISLRAERVVKIGNGENGGRVIRYSNVVVGEQVIGRWTGGAQSFALPARQAGADRWAVIVQAPRAGQIFAARIL